MPLTSRRAALSAVLLSGALPTGLCDSQRSKGAQPKGSVACAGLSLTAVDKASAKVSIPSQESTPGNKGGLSAASASAYTLEGPVLCVL